MQEQNSSSQEIVTTTIPDEACSPTPIKATEPQKPEELTEKQKRQLRRLYITKVHPTVIACGHKLHPDKQPNNNCVYCWQAFFHTVANIEELFGALRELGVKKFTAKYGTKFTKNLRGFVQAELMAKKEAEKSEENKGHGWDNNGLGVEVDGEKLEIQGSPITSTAVEEAACELKLPVS